ncbi:hypothetical protein GH714_020162 [Hevea brasiliensis]|uniref:TF-B3 domain-containing protein n=1 Tax=Hevea brasiliensis TaxID=3981 RepID=A0A6A6N4V4_HEVBR|nr:hypothetical protein GH714_020162 [Hevea brasiliensis]
MVMFSKILTSVDITRRLSAPENCIRALPPAEKGQEMSLHVKDKETGVIWTFRCKIPAEGIPAVGFSKPFVFGNWFQFVRSKDLKPGDMIVFYKEMDDEGTGAQYKIEVKKMKKREPSYLGSYCWTSPAMDSESFHM